MSEKRKRITLNSEDMPEDVYEILNEKALGRKVTPYIIEIVQQRIKDKSLLDKLEVIEAKIDRISYGNIIMKNNIGEESLEEGMLVKVNDVIGEIDENDKIECDF